MNNKMKEINPYNKVWLDCYNNLIVSLLGYMDTKYEIRGLENRYKYECIEHVAGSGQKINCITIEQVLVDLEEIAIVQNSDFDSEKEFLRLLKTHLEDENSFALLAVDLYDWVEGSICWHKFHWDHYSLIVDYNNRKNEFIAFDEKKGEYISFSVKADDLFRHIYESEDYNKFELIKLKQDISIKPLSSSEMIDNAKKIINSIKENIGMKKWWMQEIDFDDTWYKELNEVYIQRIEGRQNANALLMRTIAKKKLKQPEFAIEQLSKEFENLSREWGIIRWALCKIYSKKKSRYEKVEKINERAERCMQHEIKIWKDFIYIMEKEDDFYI